MKITQDLNRIADTTKEKIKAILFSSSFHIVLIFRISSFLTNKLPVLGNLFGFIFEHINRVVYSVEISRYAKIEGGLIIMHGAGLVIGSDVIIGKNCKIFNGVNLGNKYTEVSLNDQPSIGNNVVISCGAKCLGNITIGNNVIIGANAVVISSISDNCTAVGIPAKSIKTK